MNPLVLSNQAELGSHIELVLNNSNELDEDGWALIAPFGEHPKTRVYSEGGQVKEQKYIQVLDNEAADQMMAVENSFFRKLKRALIGIPVYKGHGDLHDVDPKALSNDAKIKIGVIDKIRKGDRGIEAHFALDNEGADAVAEGCKLPSALWLVMPIPNASIIPGGSPGMTGGSPVPPIRCRPFKLISVALTRYPNISGVESLANSSGNVTLHPFESKTGTQQETNVMKDQIIGMLIGKGVAVPAAASDGELMAILANGDYVAPAVDQGKEVVARAQAHMASAHANDKPAHQAAQAKHLAAAKAFDTAGDAESAQLHRDVAKYHAARIERFNK